MYADEAVYSVTAIDIKKKLLFVLVIPSSEFPIFNLDLFLQAIYSTAIVMYLSWIVSIHRRHCEFQVDDKEYQYTGESRMMDRLLPVNFVSRYLV